MPVSKRHANEFFIYLSEQRACSKNTIIAYRRDIERFQIFLTEKKITQEEIEKHLSRVIREFIRRLHVDGLSNRSVCRVLSGIKSFFKYLHSRNITEENLGTAIYGLKFEKKLPRFLLKTDVERLLEFPDPESFLGSRDLAIIELLYSTGCRLSEVCSVEYNDIDIPSGSLRVLGKGSKERIVPVGKYARMALENYLVIRRTQFPQVRTERIFLNRMGGPLSTRTISRIIRKYSSLLGTVDPISPHVLRHSFATHLLDNGADIMAIKEMLGHSSLSTTQIYSHVSLEKLKRVYDQSHPRSGK